MILGGDFSEKLAHVMTATALCCATVTIDPSLLPPAGMLGVVEAVLGGTALAHLLWRRRSEKFVVIARRCAREIDDDSDQLIEDEFRSLPDASANRDAAIAAIRDVLPRIVPKPEELVTARLSEDRVAAFYLDRAAKERPYDFALITSNDPDDMARRDLARRLFASVVGKAYAVIARQPEFAAEILRHSLADLLRGQDTLRDDTQQIRGDTQEIMRRQREDAEHLAERLARLEALLTQNTAAPAPLAERAASEIIGAAAADHRLAEALDRLQQGDIAAAEVMFRTIAEEKAARIARDRRDAAAAYRNLGAIAGLRDPKRAFEAYAQAAEFDSEDRESLLWLAWLSLDRGALGDAEQNCRRLLALGETDEAAWYSYWAQVLLGNIQVQRGNLASAKRGYEGAMSLAERLAQSDRGNAGWQRDLSVSYDRVGDVLVAQGNLPEALKSFRDGLVSSEAPLFLRYPRLAKPGKEGFLGQQADLGRPEKLDAFEPGDTRIAPVSAQPASFGQFGFGSHAIALQCISGSQPRMWSGEARVGASRPDKPGH